MRLTADQRNRITTRVVEAAREIGVLLLAFAPLEFTIQSGHVPLRELATFLLFGTALFMGSVAAEIKNEQ